MMRVFSGLSFRFILLENKSESGYLTRVKWANGEINGYRIGWNESLIFSNPTIKEIRSLFCSRVYITFYGEVINL